MTTRMGDRHPSVEDEEPLTGEEEEEEEESELSDGHELHQDDEESEEEEEGEDEGQDEDQDEDEQRDEEEEVGDGEQGEDEEEDDEDGEEEEEEEEEVIQAQPQPEDEEEDEEGEGNGDDEDNNTGDNSVGVSSYPATTGAAASVLAAADAVTNGMMRPTTNQTDHLSRPSSSTSTLAPTNRPSSPSASSQNNSRTTSPRTPQTSEQSGPSQSHQQPTESHTSTLVEATQSHSSSSLPSSRSNSRPSTGDTQTASSSASQPLTEPDSESSSPPPRPSTPIEITSGAAGDVIDGPLRREVSTESEKEIKQMKFAQGMAREWMTLLHQRSTALNGAEGKLTQQETSYLLTHLVPILVEGMSELLRVHEEESKSLHQHAKKVRKNPSMKPMNELVPLEWLASYLVRHNPKHVANTNPLTQIYEKSIQEAVREIEQ